MIYYTVVAYEVVMMPEGTFMMLPVSVCPTPYRLYHAATDHLRHQDHRAKAAPHVSPRRAQLKKRAPTPSSASGERRKAPSRGWLAVSPGRQRIRGNGGVFTNIGTFDARDRPYTIF